MSDNIHFSEEYPQTFHGFRALEAPAELPHRSHRFQEAPPKIVKGTAGS